MTPQCLLFSI
uniref:Uncharacterized protein n=1 Tax=Anguilla anguilla TaxID=7936 RepID=A0A0E9UWN2_ANGAN